MKQALIVASFVSAYFGLFSIAFICVILGMIGGAWNDRHNEA